MYGLEDEDNEVSFELMALCSLIGIIIGLLIIFIFPPPNRINVSEMQVNACANHEKVCLEYISYNLGTERGKTLTSLYNGSQK